MTPSLISVVIPAYNSATFLASTLESVFAQDHRPLEVIVVDDGSTDETLAIAQAWTPGLSIVRQANAGPGAARNRGIEIAKGAFIAFIDADDLWPAGKLARQLRLLQNRPDLDLVLGLVHHRCLGSAPRPLSAGDGRTVVNMHFGAGLFRRSCFERVGLLSEDLADSEDHDWFLRAKEAGIAWQVSADVALIYQRHGGNMTAQLTLENSEMFRVLARAASRRRARWGGAIPPFDRLCDRLGDRRLPEAAPGTAGKE